MSDDHPDAPPPPPPYPGAPAPPPSYPGAPPPPQSYPGAPAPPPSYPGAPPPYAPPPPSYPGAGGGYYPPGAPPPSPWSTAPGPGYGAPYPGAVPYASYWARVGGFLIDGVILFAVYAVVLLLTNGYHTHTTSNGAQVHFPAGSELILLAIGALYASFLIGLRGQTVGMMVARTKVVDANTGGLIGFWRALGRDLFERLLTILLLIPWIVDMLFPAWDARNQTLHDKVVNTVVIKI